MVVMSDFRQNNRPIFFFLQCLLLLNPPPPMFNLYILFLIGRNHRSILSLSSWPALSKSDRASTKAFSTDSLKELSHASITLSKVSSLDESRAITISRHFLPRASSSPDPSTAPWKKWLMGLLLTVILPAIGHKGGLFVGLKDMVSVNKMQLSMRSFAIYMATITQ